MPTLLLGLLGIRAVDRARQGGNLWKSLGILLLVILGGAVGLVDYGYLGVLTVIAFGVLRDFRGEKLAQLVAMILLHGVLVEGRVFILGSFEIKEQILAVLALIPIWLYRGERGYHSKWFRYLCYGFYPVHMLILGVGKVLL